MEFRFPASLIGPKPLRNSFGGPQNRRTDIPGHLNGPKQTKRVTTGPTSGLRQPILHVRQPKALVRLPHSLLRPAAPPCAAAAALHGGCRNALCGCRAVSSGFGPMGASRFSYKLDPSPLILKDRIDQLTTFLIRIASSHPPSFLVFRI